MSVEEDTELRDLLTQTLEANGCLSKIRAQLRASIVLALHEDENLQKKTPLENEKVKTQLESADGQLMFCLVREFLEFFNLDFTISVYEPETYLGTSYNYEGRCKIIKDLGLSQLEDNVPLILQLVKYAQLNKKVDVSTEEEHSGMNHYADSFQSVSDIEKSMDKDKKRFNETFDVSNSGKDKDDNNTSTKHLYNINNKTYSMKEDTLDESSLAAGDVSNLINLDQSIKSSSLSNSHHKVENEKSRSLLDQSISEQEKVSSNDAKSLSKYDAVIDKIKLSPQKSEKLKAKSNLSSLTDLPPLQINKSRDSMALPLLYSSKYNRKDDLDKFIDVDTFDNYEEDFMPSGELELGLTKFNVKEIIKDAVQVKGNNYSEKNGNAMERTNGVNLSDNEQGVDTTETSISQELHTEAEEILRTASN